MRRVRLLARDRASSWCSRPRPSCSPPAASARRGSSRRTRGSTRATASRSALDAGADLIDMEFIQFHPTGMVWPPSVRGILVTEGVRGDGGTLKNTEGKRFMFNYIPEFFKARDGRQRGGGRRLVRGQEDNRRTPDLLPRDEVARAINAEVKAGRGAAPRRRLPRHRHAPVRRLHQEAPAVDVPPVQGAGGRRHHEGADGGRPDLPLHHGRHPGRRRHGGDRRCPASSRRARWPAACTAPTASAATRCPTCSCSAAAPGSPRPSTPRRLKGKVNVDARAGRGGGRRPCSSRSTRTGQREPVRHPRRSPGVHAGARRHHPHRGRAAEGAGGDRRVQAARSGASAWAAAGSTTRAGTWRSTCTRCCPSPRR